MHSTSDRRQPTILVVEDATSVRASMTEALESAGFDVIAVTAAEDAMGLAFMDVEVDLLFTGIGLSGPLDGWELAETMREMVPGLPVIYACDPAADNGARVPDSVIVSKPYDPLKICALIERHVALRNDVPEASSVQQAAPGPEHDRLRQTA